MNIPTEFLTVALGDSLLLNCTYNCSTGFVRGCWSKVPDNSGCHGTIRTSTFCTVSLHLPNVSMEDLNKNYTCYTQNTEDFQLLQKMERIVLLQLPGEKTLFDNINSAYQYRYFRLINSTFPIKLYIDSFCLFVCYFFTSVFLAQTGAPNFTETPETKTKSGEDLSSSIIYIMINKANLRVFLNSYWLLFMYNKHYIFSAPFPMEPKDASEGETSLESCAYVYKCKLMYKYKSICRQ